MTRCMPGVGTITTSPRRVMDMLCGNGPHGRIFRCAHALVSLSRFLQHGLFWGAEDCPESVIKPFGYGCCRRRGERLTGCFRYSRFVSGFTKLQMITLVV